MMGIAYNRISFVSRASGNGNSGEEQAGALGDHRVACRLGMTTT